VAPRGGLVNPGKANLCYANSALQAVLSCKPLTALLSGPTKPGAHPPLLAVLDQLRRVHQRILIRCGPTVPAAAPGGRGRARPGHGHGHGQGRGAALGSGAWGRAGRPRPALGLLGDALSCAPRSLPACTHRLHCMGPQTNRHAASATKLAVN
jgi:hypothetical protein